MASYEPAKTGTAAAETMNVTVDMTPAEFEMFSKNQIHFAVDNQTPFTLNPNSTTFADWKDFASGPKTEFLPRQYTLNGDGGHVISSRSPFTGSAGMVGYSITGPSGATICLRMLGTNPYLSARKNWAYVSIPKTDEAIDQDHYNKLYTDETQSASTPFEGKTLMLKGAIGQADEATATFSLAFA